MTTFAVLKGLILNLNFLFQGAVSFHLSVGTQNQTWLLLVKIKCDIFVNSPAYSTTESFEKESAELVSLTDKPLY